MLGILEFTQSIFGHWKVLLGAAVAMAAVVATENLLGFSLPAGILWAIALMSLFLACYRAWDDERLGRVKSEEAAFASAPQVLVHFDCEMDNPKPLTLINVSDEAAFNVKLDDLHNGDCVAKFDVVAHLLKEWVAVAPRVEGNGSAAAERTSLMTVLEAEAPDSGAASRIFPLRVSYTNFQGRSFETQYDIHYDGLTRRAVARLNPAAGKNGTSRSRLEYNAAQH